MAKKEKKPVILSMDGKEYTEDDLNGNEKAIEAYNHILNLQRKLEQSVFNHREMEGGKLYWQDQLSKALNEEEAEEAKE
jgi:hypothetical protein|tara:strand:- start:556 stop:792 length:237 start_codon:yes stop_codon:yes gene_type:complete